MLKSLTFRAFLALFTVAFILLLFLHRQPVFERTWMWAWAIGSFILSALIAGYTNELFVVTTYASEMLVLRNGGSDESFTAKGCYECWRWEKNYTVFPLDGKHRNEWFGFKDGEKKYFFSIEYCLPQDASQAWLYIKQFGPSLVSRCPCCGEASPRECEWIQSELLAALRYPGNLWDVALNQSAKKFYDQIMSFLGDKLAAVGLELKGCAYLPADKTVPLNVLDGS